MSNATSDSPDSGRQRRRSRGGKGRNRNRQNQDGSPRNDRRDGRDGRDGREGRESRGRREPQERLDEGGPQRSRSRRTEPVKLTFWQKLLKAIGLYKEPQRPARSPRTEVKSNTRIAKGVSEARETREPREPRETREPRDARDDREPREPRKRRERREPREAGRDHRGASQGEVESNRLYLGNLSYDATESDLEELFKGVGSVRRVEIVYNRATHRSKGYGFVDMLNIDETKRAVEVLHDQFFMGRQLVVSGAKSQGPAGESDDDIDSNDDNVRNETPADSAPVTPEVTTPVVAEAAAPEVTEESAPAVVEESDPVVAEEGSEDRPQAS